MLYSTKNQQVKSSIFSEKFNALTSLDMRWTNVHPILKIALKNYFRLIPSD